MSDCKSSLPKHSGGSLLNLWLMDQLTTALTSFVSRIVLIHYENRAFTPNHSLQASCVLGTSVSARSKKRCAGWFSPAILRTLALTSSASFAKRDSIKIALKSVIVG